MFWSVNARVRARGYLHTPVSAHHFSTGDQMTRWAVINELSTEHFWPGGKWLPWWSQSVSGHRGRGRAAQRTLCLCQDSPEEPRTGLAHLDNTRPVTALHLSIVTLKSYDGNITLPSDIQIQIIIPNYSTTGLGFMVSKIIIGFASAYILEKCCNKRENCNSAIAATFSGISSFPGWTVCSLRAEIKKMTFKVNTALWWCKNGAGSTT